MILPEVTCVSVIREAYTVNTWDFCSRYDDGRRKRDIWRFTEQTDVGVSQEAQERFSPASYVCYLLNYVASYKAYPMLNFSFESSRCWGGGGKVEEYAGRETER